MLIDARVLRLVRNMTGDCILLVSDQSQYSE